MKTLIHLACPALLATLLVGCNYEGGPAGQPQVKGVAVIDLDVVAQSLGSDKQIASAMQQRTEALNQQLVKLAKGYIAELEKHQVHETPEDSELGVQLAAYQEKANKTLGAAKRQAQQDLSKHRSQLVRQFRDSVRPVAREVANRRGYAVIVTKQEGLLFDYSPEADITAEVAEALKARMTAGSAE